MRFMIVMKSTGRHFRLVPTELRHRRADGARQMRQVKTTQAGSERMTRVMAARKRRRDIRVAHG